MTPSNASEKQAMIYCNDCGEPRTLTSENNETLHPDAKYVGPTNKNLYYSNKSKCLTPECIAHQEKIKTMKHSHEIFWANREYNQARQDAINRQIRLSSYAL